jgi:hypothetical protein
VLGGRAKSGEFNNSCRTRDKARPFVEQFDLDLRRIIKEHLEELKQDEVDKLTQPVPQLSDHEIKETLFSLHRGPLRKLIDKICALQKAEAYLAMENSGPAS